MKYLEMYLEQLIVLKIMKNNLKDLGGKRNG